jgi:hypothetical protein
MSWSNKLCLLKILGDYDAKKRERINHDMNDEEIKNKPLTNGGVS